LLQGEHQRLHFARMVMTSGLGLEKEPDQPFFFKVVMTHPIGVRRGDTNNSFFQIGRS
jgi:hypothetical protein